MLYKSLLHCIVHFLIFSPRRKVKREENHLVELVWFYVCVHVCVMVMLECVCLCVDICVCLCYCDYPLCYHVTVYVSADRVTVPVAQ